MNRDTYLDALVVAVIGMEWSEEGMEMEQPIQFM